MHYSKSLIHTCPSDRKTVIWLNLRSNPDILLRSSKGWGCHFGAKEHFLSRAEWCLSISPS